MLKRFVRHGLTLFSLATPPRNRHYYCVLLFTVGMISQALPGSAAYENNIEEAEKERFLFEMYLAGQKNVLNNPADVRIQVAENLKKVAHFQMDPETFYKQLARMEMPPGMEQRHLLQLVKKDIEKFRGSEGMKEFFGSRFDAEKKVLTEEQKNIIRQTMQDIHEDATGKMKKGSGGGTMVERRLHVWRRQLVNEGIKSVLASSKGLNIIDGVPFRVYVAEIGSWSDESPEAMRFAGDIDFSFVCGDLSVAMALKEKFDAYIMKRLGMSAEALDTPATAHGMATPEVFVGKHGQKFAEDVLKYVKEVELGGKPFNEAKQVAPSEVLEVIGTQAKLAKNPLPRLVELKWPTEPGISLEMIRHFEHDIVKKAIFGDIDSFLKACKYLQRSAKATRDLAEAKKIALTPENDKLTRFADEMMALKKAAAAGTASQTDMVGVIRNYFAAIDKPFPFEVKLGPENTNGESAVKIAAKEEIIKGFWEDCFKAMHANAIEGFKVQFDDYKTKAASASSESEIKNVANELLKMREMLEVEMRVLQDPDVGIDKIPPDLLKLVKNFRTEFKDFMTKNGDQVLQESMKKGYRAMEELLKAQKPTATYLAMSYLASAPEKLNAYIDVLDDTLMRGIRGDGGQTWQEYVSGQRELQWADKVNRFLGWDKIKLSTLHYSQLSRVEDLVHHIEDRVNTIIAENLAARGIRKINMTLNESIQSNAAGRAGMKMLVAYNLSKEIPVYIDLFGDALDKGTYEAWAALGTEFFRRRVPFGSAAEAAIMGDYTTAAWMTTVTLIPPAALFQTAKHIGEELGNYSWDFYWQKELELFIDTLYDEAHFKPLSVDKIGENIELTDWKLVEVTYRDRTVDVQKFIQEKSFHLKEMERYFSERQADLQKRKAGQKVNRDDAIFPVELAYKGITAWMELERPLREDVLRNDPWLVTVEQMMEHPAVGPKLKSYYQEMWIYRWEQLKYKFFNHLVAQLEARKSAEKSILSGQVAAMFQELIKISRDLKIQQEVLEQFDKESGRGFLGLLYWLWDNLRGKKREFIGEPDVWDAYEEGVVVLTKYLKTFKTIQRDRERAEKLYTRPPLEDEGTRLLTGRYFLSGNADSDIKSYTSWADMPAVINRKNQQLLLEIKQKYLPEAALDLSPNSFDSTIFLSIAAHDRWREIWKMIHTKSQPGDTILARLSDYPQSVTELIDNVLGRKVDEEQRAQAPSAPGAGDQHKALERHRFHAENYNRLITKFELHYFKERSTVLLAKLQKLAVAAESLSSDADWFLVEAKNIGDDSRAVIENIEADTAVYQDFITQIEKIAAEARTLAERLHGDHHISGEKAVVHLAEQAPAVEGLSLEICEAAQSMKNTPAVEKRQQIYQRIKALQGRLAPMLTTGRQQCAHVRTASKQAASDHQLLTNKLTQIPPLSGLDEAIAQVKSAQADLSEALGQIISADEKVAAIAPLLAEADMIMEELQKLVGPVQDTDHGKETLSQAEYYRVRIEKAAEQVLGRPESYGQDIQQLKDKAQNIETSLAGYQTTYDEVKKDLGGGAANPGSIGNAGSCKDATVYLGELGQTYLDRIEQAAADGAFCAVLGQDLLSSPSEPTRQSPPPKLTVQMPNLRGLRYNQAIGLLEQSGLVPDGRILGDAPRKDLEYAVKAQMTAAGTRLDAGTSVSFTYYGPFDVEAALAQVDCSALPGSVPVYDSNSQRAGCTCPAHLAWNTANSRCIDCSIARSQFNDALARGDQSTATAVLAEALNCSGIESAQQALHDLNSHQAQCRELLEVAYGAYNMNDLGAATAYVQQAQANNCQTDQQLINAINQAISAHNRREQQRQNQEALQQYLNQIQSIFNQTRSSGTTRRPPPRHQPPPEQTGPPPSSGGNDCPGGVDLIGNCVDKPVVVPRVPGTY